MRNDITEIAKEIAEIRKDIKVIEARLDMRARTIGESLNLNSRLMAVEEWIAQHAQERSVK